MQIWYSKICKKFVITTQRIPNYGWKIIVLDLLIAKEVLLLVYPYVIVLIFTLEIRKNNV